jgi:decaprenylphospho-beta-D-ribofuranose 2-oxidase
MSDAHDESLTGWGGTAPSVASVVEPQSAEQLAAVLDDPPARGVLARGLGRSYGDAAQNGGGRVAVTTAVEAVRWVADGAVEVSAGLSLEELLRWCVRQGWFIPVSPGTRYVTIGGAIASDIHGKNHHVDGSFGNHVMSITLATPALGTVTITPEDRPDLFWSTVGGMGLTGVILEAVVRLLPIETSLITVDTDRMADLDSVMAAMEERDHRDRYSVAWIDLLAKGTALGRSVLTRGHFAPLDALPARRRQDPLAYDPKVIGFAPPMFPSGALNKVTIGAFNELWFRKSPRHRTGELQSIARFFHPLDMVRSWNRLYGRRGFLQWQPLIPFGREDLLHEVVRELSELGCPSFLAVLKRFGPGNASPLSFPQPGWTLALDVPVPGAGSELPHVLNRMDREITDAGGRVYLAKDSSLDPALVPRMYPELDRWRAVRREVDPKGVLQSDLARRLGL